ncbi:MAG TPA: hypothetical protein VF712_04420 [Thermoleophilaceae bacterium]|jgi:hypothetical protein
MRIPAVLAVVLVGLGLAADAAVAAPPPLRAFPAQHGRAYPVTDGLRYFVIDREPGVVRVVDTRTGEGTDAAVRAQCDARGATAGIALVGCTDDAHPWLMRLSTRRMAPLEIGQGEIAWHDIGRHWLLGGYHENRPVVVYTAWRPDERGRRDGFSGDGFESPRFDLDDPELRPISAQHTIFDRDGTGVLKDLRKARGSDVRLVLDRGSRRVVLSHCRGGCAHGSLSGGVATWSEGDTVRAYVERTGRRHRWSYDGPARPAAVVHTRTHVLAALPVSEPPYVPRLRWARVRE